MDFEDQKRVFEKSFSCSCNSRFSRAWSETNEEKSVDLETSSSRSEVSEEIFIVKERENGNFCPYENEFCSSPFRFVLQKTPSPGHRLPEFSSPATSPIRHKKELTKNEAEEEEKEKDQYSPVSVLDPPFLDQEEDDEEEEVELERSFAIVQRTLLHKLRRFEKLAGLDPIELEKRLTEEDDEEENEFVKKVIGSPAFYNGHRKNSPDLDMKRLILDLTAEEEAVSDDREVLVGKVRKRLDSWKYVDSNTIDMMVGWDIRREGDEWRRNNKQGEEIGMEIEVAILGFLVEEISEELVSV